MINNSAVVYISLAFSTLGILIGSLVSMSDQSLAQPLMAAMFALFGGSLIVFFDKFEAAKLLAACVAVFAISSGALLGIYSGILITEHQILSPRVKNSAGDKTGTAVARKYLRENVLSEAQEIDMKLRNDLITPKQAYDELRKLYQAD